MTELTRTTLGLGVVAGALALSATALSAQEITVEHAQGEVTLPGVPEKVFAYDMASIDTLDALGIEVDGVPEANYPDSLSSYASDDVMKIGSLFEPDYELVNAEQPDLTIVAGRSSTAFDQLSALSPTVDLTNGWEGFTDQVKLNSERLGRLFGREDDVANMIAELDGSIADFQASAEDIGEVFVVMTNAGEVTAYGPGSRFGFVHDDLGLIPAVEDVEAATHGDAMSFEFILETDPDWLIVIDRDSAVGTTTGAAEQVLDNELVRQTTAWQQDQVIYVDSTRWYIVNGGINNLNAMVDELADAMLAE